jgi:mannonate dehydratase
MKIAECRVIVCSPAGQTYVTVKVITDAGVYGIGDATLAGRELAVVAYLNQHLLPTLIGKDPAQTEELWQYMYRSAYWRGGPIAMTAIGAVDLALWDLKGKVLNTPVYNLLGGRSRRGIRAYAHAWGQTIDETVAAAEACVNGGYTAVRFSASIPELSDAYRELHRSPPSSDPGAGPPEETWDTRPYLDFLPNLAKRLRDELGRSVDLLHDTHHRLTPTEASQLARRLEPFELYWLEDPIRPSIPEDYLRLRQQSTTPIAIGETLHDLPDCYPYITQRLADYLRLAPSHAGGLTNLRRVAALAAARNINMACHGPIDISPIGLAAAIHFGFSVHNVGLQEHVPHHNDTESVFTHAFSFQEGHLMPGEAPGLGVDLDERRANSFPYERSYLPVVRKLDGTVHDW